MSIKSNLIISSLKSQTYADEGHDLDGVLEHVYGSMEQYYSECLSLDSDDTKPDVSKVPAE